MVETILTKLAEMLFDGLSGFAEGFLGVLDCDLSIFEEAFPIVGTLYAIFQGFAVGLVFLLVLWQAFKTFGLPLGAEVENPVMVMMKGFLAIFCIIFAKDIILDYIFPLFSPTYDALLEVDGSAKSLTLTQALGTIDITSLSTAIDIVAFKAGAVIKTIGLTICMIILLLNFLKLLLEVVERYILLGVIIYTSPLAFASLPSLSTSSIFKGWSSMVFGQMTMLLLNVWTIKMFFSVMNAPMKYDNFFLWFFIALGFLKVAQRLDSYMQQIGINVGTTGNALGGAIIGLIASNLGGSAIKGAARGLMKGVSGAFGGAAAGAAAGAAGAGISSMAAVGAGGAIGAALKAQGGGLKGGLKGVAKAAVKSKWTTPGAVGAMAAGVGATKAFKAAGNKLASSRLGKHLPQAKAFDPGMNPSEFIKNTRTPTSGGAADSPAMQAFTGAFDGGANVPAFNQDDLSYASVGNGQATVKGSFYKSIKDENGNEKRVREPAVFQFSRTDMYNQPSGRQDYDWSICQDKSGNSYYVTKMKRDKITERNVINSPTKK